ncbi:hypothetical protein DAPPUDRAFT_108212 [Daphnia pulex]|uniref:CCHC-type domain-containing protein n=1 Tax=Daphnia pulex TaxID=6669 RepID=E9GZH2_DAPPU|nr:hypothetical protein DAPPUDRAFT_108212 [Daphnia pulex]|eukprot:EFX75158.1 hypothetical protein DAPPUDRAFT_108212 [Daphnia pulex]
MKPTAYRLMRFPRSRRHYSNQGPLGFLSNRRLTVFEQSSIRRRVVLLFCLCRLLGVSLFFTRPPLIKSCLVLSVQNYCVITTLKPGMMFLLDVKDSGNIHVAPEGKRVLKVNAREKDEEKLKIHETSSGDKTLLLTRTELESTKQEVEIHKNTISDLNKVIDKLKEDTKDNVAQLTHNYKLLSDEHESLNNACKTTDSEDVATKQLSVDSLRYTNQTLTSDIAALRLQLTQQTEIVIDEAIAPPEAIELARSLRKIRGEANQKISLKGLLAAIRGALPTVGITEAYNRHRSSSGDRRRPNSESRIHFQQPPPRPSQDSSYSRDRGRDNSYYRSRSPGDNRYHQTVDSRSRRDQTPPRHNFSNNQSERSSFNRSNNDSFRRRFPKNTPYPRPRQFQDRAPNNFHYRQSPYTGTRPRTTGNYNNPRDNRTRRDIECYACGKREHYARECRTNPPQTPQQRQ